MLHEAELPGKHIQNDGPGYPLKEQLPETGEGRGVIPRENGVDQLEDLAFRGRRGQGFNIVGTDLFFIRVKGRDLGDLALQQVGIGAAGKDQEIRGPGVAFPAQLLKERVTKEVRAAPFRGSNFTTPPIFSATFRIFLCFTGSTL